MNVCSIWRNQSDFWTPIGLFIFTFTVLWISHLYGFVGLRGFVQGDLGLLLNVPWRIVQGQIPYRDFYAGNYTPGSYYYHALLFSVFGIKASILSKSLVFSQSLGVVFFFLLLRQVFSKNGALGFSILAILLAIPNTNIPFPAVYCVLFGLASFYGTIRYCLEKKPLWFAFAGFWLGLAFAFKISAGAFLLAFIFWIFLYAKNYIRTLQVYSLILTLMAFLLIRQRFYLATVLLFVVPVFFLFLWSLRFQVSNNYRLNWKKLSVSFLALFFPVTVITLIWVIPFLGILGPEKFFHHFFIFPSLQPKILYFAPAFPAPLAAHEFMSRLGFAPYSRWGSVWKFWFYLPFLMAFWGTFGLKKEFYEGPKRIFVLGFVAYNGLFSLQLFPQVDHLHWKWSVHGAFLLLAIFLGQWLKEGKKVRVYFMVSVLISLQSIHYGRFFLKQKSAGGFQKSFPNEINISYPRDQSENLKEVALWLKNHLHEGEVFWNPPGNLLNFILRVPTPYPSDYFGPPYWQKEDMEQMIQALNQKPPQFIVIPNLKETHFGWQAFGRNFPLLEQYVVTHYPKQKEMGDYLIFYDLRLNGLRDHLF